MRMVVHSPWGPLLDSRTEAVIASGGRAAKDWLGELPRTIAALAASWRLNRISPLAGGRASCVLACEDARGRACVLKVAPPWNGIVREAHALSTWGPSAAPEVIAVDPDRDALLMERVSPGEPIAGPGHAAEIANLADRLHVDPPRDGPIPALADEFAVRVVERIHALGEDYAQSVSDLPARIQRSTDGHALRIAHDQAAALLASPAPPALLHGDLSAGSNVLVSVRRGARVIDPRACVGDREYDLALWANTATAGDGVLAELDGLTHLAGVSSARLRAWATVFACLRLCGCRDERRHDRAATLDALGIELSSATR